MWFLVLIDVQQKDFESLYEYQVIQELASSYVKRDIEVSFKV